jgi:hypothetical protein
MLLLLFLSLCWGASQPAANEEVGCLDTTPKAMEAARALEEAFLNAEEEQFLSLHRQLQHEIQCMVSSPGAKDVVQLHRSMAIWQFVSGQHAASRGSFAAVQQLDPMWSIESWGLPEGHELRHLWEQAPKDTSRQTLRSPPGGWLIDGKPGDMAPMARPALFQGFYANNTLWYSAVAKSLAEIPEPPVDEEKTQRRRKSIRLGGTIGGGALVATSAALIGVATARRAQLKNGSIEYGELDDARHSINTMTATGVVFGGIGLISGTLVWTIPW